MHNKEKMLNLVPASNDKMSAVLAEIEADAGSDEEPHMTHEERTRWALRVRRVFLRPARLWTEVDQARWVGGIVITGNLPTFHNAFPFEHDLLLPHLGVLLAGIPGLRDD
jgi:hypothetical protein